MVVTAKYVVRILSSWICFPKKFTARCVGFAQTVFAKKVHEEQETRQVQVPPPHFWALLDTFGLWLLSDHRC